LILRQPAAAVDVAALDDPNTLARAIASRTTEAVRRDQHRRASRPIRHLGDGGWHVADIVSLYEPYVRGRIGRVCWPMLAFLR
jgi:hypothetical protein